MRRTAVSILATTGTALVVLAAYAALNGGRVLLLGSVFQTLGASCVIHAGLNLLRRFESPYAALEAAVDIAWTVAVLLICGALFGWYASTPAPVLIVMAALIYAILFLLSVVRTRGEVSRINKLLIARRKETKEAKEGNEP